jgi:hypothetical protein
MLGQDAARGAVPVPLANSAISRSTDVLLPDDEQVFLDELKIKSSSIQVAESTDFISKICVLSICRILNDGKIQ